MFQKWRKNYLHRAKFLLGVVLPVSLVIVFVFFYEKPVEEKHIGYYYPYNLANGMGAVAIGAGLGCDSLKKYSEIIEGGIQTHPGYSLDTIGIPIERSVELVAILCDSTVGLIKVSNPWFDENIRESKTVNQRHYRVMIALKDLHLQPLGK